MMLVQKSSHYADSLPRESFRVGIEGESKSGVFLLLGKENISESQVLRFNLR